MYAKIINFTASCIRVTLNRPSYQMAMLRPIHLLFTQYHFEVINSLYLERFFPQPLFEMFGYIFFFSLPFAEFWNKWFFFYQLQYAPYLVDYLYKSIQKLFFWYSIPESLMSHFTQELFLRYTVAAVRKLRSVHHSPLLSSIFHHPKLKV